MNIGDSAKSVNVIEFENIQAFAKLSGDNNPIHLDEEFAKKSIFKKKIAHGLYVSSSISALIANKLPGIGSIYLHQSLDFRKPVFIGDTITTEVRLVSEIKPGIFELSTNCYNQNGDVVITGKAIVKHNEPK